MTSEHRIGHHALLHGATLERESGTGTARSWDGRRLIDARLDRRIHPVVSARQLPAEVVDFSEVKEWKVQVRVPRVGVVAL